MGIDHARKSEPALAVEDALRFGRGNAAGNPRELTVPDRNVGFVYRVAPRAHDANILDEQIE
jgi:hypothetical protein